MTSGGNLGRTSRTSRTLRGRICSSGWDVSMGFFFLLFLHGFKQLSSLMVELSTRDEYLSKGGRM
jgi:hypothetical protein